MSDQSFLAGDGPEAYRRRQRPPTGKRTLYVAPAALPDRSENQATSPISSTGQEKNDRPQSVPFWMPGMPVPPLVRPPQELVDASLQAAASKGVDAPPPSFPGGAPSDASTKAPTSAKTSPTSSSSSRPKTSSSPSIAPPLSPRPVPPPPPPAGELLPPPVDDEARSSIVEELLKACEPGDPVLASICRLLRSVLSVPMASVTLISHEQAWFRGGELEKTGGGGRGGGGSCAVARAKTPRGGETSASPPSTNKATAATNDPDPMPRGRVLCAYSLIGEPDIVVIEDALTDPRTRFSPLVGQAGLRFYAGAPLIGSTGARLGSLCCTDLVPRKLSPDNARVLANFAELVVRQLEKDYFDRYQLPAASASAPSLPAAEAAAVAEARAAPAASTAAPSTTAREDNAATLASSLSSSTTTNASTSVRSANDNAGTGSTFSSRLLRSVDTVRRASAIVDVGSPGWPILCANQRWAFLTGAGPSAGDAIGKQFFELYEPSSRAGRDGVVGSVRAPRSRGGASASGRGGDGRPRTAEDVARELAAHAASGKTSREDFVLDVALRRGEGGDDAAAAAAAPATAAVAFGGQQTLRVLLRPLLAPALDEDTPAIVVPAARDGGVAVGSGDASGSESASASGEGSGSGSGNARWRRQTEQERQRRRGRNDDDDGEPRAPALPYYFAFLASAPGAAEEAASAGEGAGVGIARVGSAASACSLAGSAAAVAPKGQRGQLSQLLSGAGDGEPAAPRAASPPSERKKKQAPSCFGRGCVIS